MKKIIVFIGVILIFCTSSKEICEESVQIKILNKFLKDSLDVELEVVNNTSKNYYLQFDESKLYEPIRYFSSEYLHNIDFKLEDENKNIIGYEIVDYQCYYPENENIYKISKSTKNVFKIKAGQKKKIKMPFLLKTIINDYCWYEYERKLINLDKKYFISLEYKMYGDVDKNIISQSTKDSLNQMGYEFYDKEIISNKVPLILD